MKKLAIISTHPIQYYAPIFQCLHKREVIEIKVFYTWGRFYNETHDPGFGKQINWDLPMLDGYPYEWALNTAQKPGSQHFCGIQNPKLIERIELWQPDSILVFGWAYRSHLKLIRYFHSRIPVYFRGDSRLIRNKVGIRNAFKYFFLTWVYKHISLAFYVGTANKRYFKEYGLKEEQLVFAPHAIDNDRFSEDRKLEAYQLRQSLGIKEDGILILFAGKLLKQKGPDVLLEAFQGLNRSKVHLLITGDGEIEGELKTSVRVNKNEKTVHFLPFKNQTEMPILYQACDLFCLPSTGPETWGIAVNEAMACGKAILVSDEVGSAFDLVKTNENGLIFKAGNAGELLKKLQYLTANKATLAIYGKRSKEIIVSWDILSVAKAIESSINET